MNCGIYAVLRALQDLGCKIMKLEFESIARETEGTNPFWLSQNIIPAGYFLSGPFQPEVVLIQDRMQQGQKVLGYIFGCVEDAHMVYITNVLNNADIIIKDNANRQGANRLLSEISSIYFLLRL